MTEYSLLDLINGLNKIADNIQWKQGTLAYTGTHNGISISIEKIQERDACGVLGFTDKIRLNNECVYEGRCPEFSNLFYNIASVYNKQSKIRLDRLCNQLFNENF